MAYSRNYPHPKKDIFKFRNGYENSQLFLTISLRIPTGIPMVFFLHVIFLCLYSVSQKKPYIQKINFLKILKNNSSQIVYIGCIEG